MNYMGADLEFDCSARSNTVDENQEVMKEELDGALEETPESSRS